MSRTSTLEQMTVGKRKSALEFHWDSLWAPPIMSLFLPEDINELISIAKSVRYAGNIAKKYDMIDQVMKRRGFRRAHCGTNRVCYNFLESSAFVAKVAVDSVGMTDSPAEYMNQDYFKPFCCKVFEVHPSGVIAFIERVNPISSIEEFMSIKDDVFNLLLTKIIGKYVVDDLGATSYMNFGVRQNSYGTSFGPVIIDFPYVYETDGAKLKCMHAVPNKLGFLEPCYGDIDYDAGFNKLVCTKCGREYRAIDLAKAKSEEEIRFEYSDKDRQFAESIRPTIRAQIIEYDGSIVYDSGRKSKHYITREELNKMSINVPADTAIKVSKTHKAKRESIQDIRKRYYSELQIQYYNALKKKEAGNFNPVIETPVEKASVTKLKKDESFNGDPYAIKHIDDYEESPFIPEYVPDPGMKVKVRKTHLPDGSLMGSTEEKPVEDKSALIEELEQKVFPEINNVVDANSAHQDEVVSEQKETINIETKIYQEPKKPDQVVAEAEFRKMLREYQIAGSDQIAQEETSSIVNPELDKNPMNNPIIRPYGDATHSVYYTPPKDDILVNKIEAQAAVEEQTTEDVEEEQAAPTADISELLKRTVEAYKEDMSEDGEESSEDYDSDYDSGDDSSSEYAEVEESYNRREQQDLKKSSKRKTYVTNKRRQ